MIKTQHMERYQGLLDICLQLQATDIVRIEDLDALHELMGLIENKIYPVITISYGDTPLTYC